MNHGYKLPVPLPELLPELLPEDTDAAAWIEEIPWAGRFDLDVPGEGEMVVAGPIGVEPPGGQWTGAFDWQVGLRCREAAGTDAPHVGYWQFAMGVRAPDAESPHVQLFPLMLVPVVVGDPPESVLRLSYRWKLANERRRGVQVPLGADPLVFIESVGSDLVEQVQRQLDVRRANANGFDRLAIYPERRRPPPPSQMCPCPTCSSRQVLGHVWREEGEGARGSFLAWAVQAEGRLSAALGAPCPLVFDGRLDYCGSCGHFHPGIRVRVFTRCGKLMHAAWAQTSAAAAAGVQDWIESLVHYGSETSLQADIA